MNKNRIRHMILVALLFLGFHGVRHKIANDNLVRYMHNNGIGA